MADGSTEQNKENTNKVNDEANRLRNARQILQKAQTRYRETTQLLDTELRLQMGNIRCLKGQIYRDLRDMDHKLDNVEAMTRAIVDGGDVAELVADIAGRSPVRDEKNGASGSDVPWVLNETTAICDLIVNGLCIGHQRENVIERIDRILELLESDH